MAEHAIELFAELMAQLDRPFADRAQVLQSAGLDEGDYQRMADRWLKKLQGDGADTLAQRYGDAYESAARELVDARRGERAAPDLRFLNTDAQSFRAEAAAVPLQASTEPAPASPSPTLVHAPPLAVAPPIAPPPMIHAPEPAPSRGSPWIPEGMRNFKDIHGTQLVTDAPRKAALPFDPSARPTLPAQRDFGERSTHLGNVVPEGMRNFKDIHGTQLATDAPGGPALPFESSRPDAPVLSLEQYASLCVDLLGDPAKRSEILGRYRMSEDQRRRAEAYWLAQIAADPRVQVALDRACATYRAWLVQRHAK